VARKAFWGVTSVAVVAVLAVSPGIAATDHSTTTQPRVAFTGKRPARAASNPLSHRLP
jgi:anti-sigma-K factor RskA